MMVCAAGIMLDTELMMRYHIRLIVGHDMLDQMYVDLNIDHNGDHLSIYVQDDLDFDNVNQFVQWLICIKGRFHRLRRKLELRRAYARDDAMLYRVSVRDLKDGDFVLHPDTFAPFVVVSVGHKAILVKSFHGEGTLTLKGDDLEREWPRPSTVCYERLRRLEHHLHQLFWMRPYVHTIRPSTGEANADYRRMVR